MRRFLVIGLLAPALVSCSYLRGVGGPRQFQEPVEDIETAESAYHGLLRVPIVEEWEHQLPDQGIWAISRMEQGVPLIADDRIFLGSSRSNGLLVLERSTGRLLQEIPTVNPVQSQPVAVDDGLILADTGGYIYHVTWEGDQLWRFHAGGPIYATPTVSGERVIAVTTTDSIVTLDLKTGSWLWSYRAEEREVREELSVLGSSRSVVRDGHVYAGTSDGHLICLDETSGALQWELLLAEGRFIDVDATPVFTEDGLILVGSYSGPVVAVDPMRHAVVWRYESGVVGDITLAHGHLYFGDESGTLHALHAASGEEQWSWNPIKPPKPVTPGLGVAVIKRTGLLNTPVVGGRILMVSDLQGTLYALDAFSGKVLWRNEQRETFLGAAMPVVLDGRQVLFVTADGKLRSFVAPAGVADTLEDEPSRRQSRHLNM